MVTNCSFGILGCSIGSLSSPMCIVLKFLKMFCGRFKNI